MVAAMSVGRMSSAAGVSRAAGSARPRLLPVRRGLLLLLLLDCCDGY